MLGVVGFYMFMESLQALRGKAARVEATHRSKPSLYARAIQALPYQMKFEKSED